MLIKTLNKRKRSEAKDFRLSHLDKTLIHIANHWSLNIYFRTPPMSPVIVDLIFRLQMTLPLLHVSYSPGTVSHSFTLPNRALIIPFPPYILKHNSDPPEVNTLSQLHND